MKNRHIPLSCPLHFTGGEYRAVRVIATLMFVLAMATGCTNHHATSDDENVRVAWQQYEEAREAKDTDRSMALIDSMETAGIVSSPWADCLRAFVYDENWQMRLAELYYKKAYEALADDPAQDWTLYGDAGYRYAVMMDQRGDVAGSMAVTTTILAKAEGNSDFPTLQMASLLQLMAGCCVELNQQDEARQAYLKAYNMMETAYGKENTYPFAMLVTCYNTFHFFLGSGNYNEASAWLTRFEDALHTYEQQGDSTLIEEYRGTLSLSKIDLLRATGHDAEAAAVYDSIPDSRICNPPTIGAAADYLMAAGRYSEAADMYARLGTTFVSADSARRTFDIIKDRIAPHYSALRKAGRNAEALVMADSICAAIDSALVWQKQNDAAELAVIYQTQEKDLQLTDLRFTVYLHRLMAIALFVIILLIGYLLWRAHKYNKVLTAKNHHLYEQMQQREQAKAEEQRQLQAQPEESLTNEQQLFRRLCTLMAEQQPYTDETLNRDTLAQLLATNAKYIDQAIRTCSHGETTSTFITRYRLEHVARQLKTTNDPIALVGEMAGIPSRVTLARLFRNAYGMTCSEYRRAAREETNKHE